MFQITTNRGPREGDRKGKSTSQAIVNGDFLVRSTGGNVVPATSGAAIGDYIAFATEAITAGQALPDIGVLVADPNDLVLADTTNNSSASHNEQRMILTNSQTVNNTGTDSASGVVMQVAVVGPASDKKILCKVLY